MLLRPPQRESSTWIKDAEVRRETEGLEKGREIAETGGEDRGPGPGQGHPGGEIDAPDQEKVIATGGVEEKRGQNPLQVHRLHTWWRKGRGLERAFQERRNQKGKCETPGGKTSSSTGLVTGGRGPGKIGIEGDAPEAPPAGSCKPTSAAWSEETGCFVGS